MTWSPSCPGINRTRINILTRELSRQRHPTALRRALPPNACPRWEARAQVGRGTCPAHAAGPVAGLPSQAGVPNPKPASHGALGIRLRIRQGRQDPGPPGQELTWGTGNEATSADVTANSCHPWGAPRWGAGCSGWMAEVVTGALLTCYLNKKDLRRRENPRGETDVDFGWLPVKSMAQLRRSAASSASPAAPPSCSIVGTVGVSVQWGCPWVLT